MAEQEKIEVKYVTSLAFAFPVDDLVKHFQITIVQEIVTGNFRCYFDVVDPTKVKLAESDEVQ